MGRLDGKVAVITGGASGIGAETVRRFAQEGARVAIADLLEDRAKSLVEELGEAALFVRTDVTQEDDVKAVIEAALGSWGRLDCLFNNAGLGGVDDILEETPVDGYAHTMDVLVKGVLLGMKHAAPIMKRQRSGSIINTGSVAGLRAGFGPHVYSAAKAAVIHLSRTVAMELGEWRVRVNCICPGGIVTPIFGRGLGLSDEEAERSLETITELLARGQPIPRPGRPADIAGAAVWLASDESSFVNGHALVVDGGLIGGTRFSAANEMFNHMREMFGLPRREIPRPD